VRGSPAQLILIMVLWARYSALPNVERATIWMIYMPPRARDPLSVFPDQPSE